MDSATDREPVPPHLSLWDTISIIVGIIIGVGIFKVPAEVLSLTWDPWLALLLWIGGGLLCLLGALCYAELASAYPRSGGDYEYLTRAYGRPIGFLFAFGQFALIRTAGSIAAVAYLMAPFAARLFNLDGQDALVCVLLAAVPIVLLSVLNALGVYLGKTAQNWLTCLKLLGIVGIIAAGLNHGEVQRLWRGDEGVMQIELVGVNGFGGYKILEGTRAHPSHEWHWGLWPETAAAPVLRDTSRFGVPWDSVVNIDGRTRTSTGKPLTVEDLRPGFDVQLATVDGDAIHIRAASQPLLARLTLALIAILWAYAGWHEAAYVTSEVRNPQRTVPRALLLGTGAVMVIYLLVHLACLSALGFDAMADSTTPAADVLALVLGESGARVMCLIVVLSCLGSINGMIFTSARIYSVLGQDHALFAPLGQWSPRWRTPLRSIAVQAGLCLGFVVAVSILFPGEDGFEPLIYCTAAVVWLFFAGTISALVVLRWRDPERERPFRVPLYPVTPIIAVTCCLGMMCASVMYKPLHSAIGLGVLLLGVPLYWLSERWGRAATPPPSG